MISVVAMDDAKVPWYGVYAHGHAEEVIEKMLGPRGEDRSAPDLVGADVPLPEDGIYEVDLYGQKAWLFLWHRFHEFPRGFVVLQNDLAADSYATMCYWRRRMRL